MIHFILERPQYTVSFVSSNLARRLHSRRLHAAAVTTRIPVCLLYPWPWWQANKTPGPVLQDVDDSADFDSPSHYNYYNGTFNSTPSINDFISQRERSGSNVICRCRIHVYLSVCAHLFFPHGSSLLFHHPRRMLFSWRRNFRVSMRGDGISIESWWFILWCRPGFFVTGCRMVTRVFAAINCWRRRGGGFENAWKFSSKRAEMQGATFWFKRIVLFAFWRVQWSWNILCGRWIKLNVDSLPLNLNIEIYFIFFLFKDKRCLRIHNNIASL